MATRAEILAELGLAPQWRLRDGGVPAPTVPDVSGRADGGTGGIGAAAAAGLATAATTATTADLPPGSARRDRIAALPWDALAPDIAQCTACGLCKTRRLTVPGVGDPAAEWMFVGEAPGAEEDARGEPFVGQAGRLLDSMLAALGMSRAHNVYIANVLKCRPPNNRTPEPGEAEACEPYLARQIELIRPKLIVALGKSAASLLLGTDATIASLRGRIHRYREVPLLVTYHPAYLLRNLPDKAKAWEDLVLARATVAAAGDRVQASLVP